jgi:phospholipid transport system substrate-binding protein
MLLPLTRRCVLIAGGLFPAVLAPIVLAPAGAHAQDGGPGAPVQALDDALLAAMHAGRATPFAQRAAALQPVIVQTFDLEAILRSSVGPLYARLPPQQQADLLKVFTDYTVATYVSNFDSYAGEKFVLDPQTRTVGSDQIVQTQIVPANGSPTRLDYVMRQISGSWRAVDVLVDGTISRAAVQRSDFRSLLRGGSAQPLIASLQAKAQRLANGEKS